MPDRKRMLDDLDRDIRDHIARETQDNIDRGMSPDEARFAALRKFGNVTRIKEDARGVWISVWFEQLLQDLRYAFRTLRKSPGFTIVAVLTLALGIGANTAVFSAVNTLLLHSLPFHEAERLAVLQNFFPPHDSATQFHDWQQQSTYLADAALFEDLDVNVGGTSGLTRVHVAQASSNFFTVLGTQPVLGRGFASGDEVDAPGWGLPGRNAVAVIGYGLWQQLFGGDSKALGATIHVDGNMLTIIGIAPPGFDYPAHSALWKPAAFSPGNNGWVTIARLKTGISWAQARAAFAVEAEQLSPKPANVESSDVRPRITSLQEGLLGPVKDASLILMGAVAVVLLIACTNIAGLLTARTADRVAEMRIRSALGASRTRLTRQLLTECLLLSFFSAVAGLFVAYWTIPLAAKVEPPPLGVQSYSILDEHVVVFTLIVSVIAPLVFGLLPALYAVQIRDFGAWRPSTTRVSRLIRKTPLVAQVMLTMALLSASVLVGRAFANLMKIDRGYDVEGIVSVSVSLDGTTYQSGERQVPYFEEVLDRIRSLPGVRSASATEFLPLYATGFVGGPFGIDGHPANHNSIMVPVFSDYFRTMGGQILYGREFNDSEVRSRARVAVVNEPLAAAFGAPADIVGRQLTAEDTPPWKIVGVVKGIEYETDPTIVKPFQVFVPPTKPGIFPPATFVARVDGPAEYHLAAIRDAVRSVDPKVPVFGVKTMKQRLDEMFARPEFYRATVWVFAGFTLLLIVIGIYGLLAYTVARRTKEIGIRMALGATQSKVGRMVVGEALLMVCAGVAGGVPLSFWIKRLAAGLMGGSAGSIATPIAFGALAIFAVTLLAAYFPARSSMRVDPIVALRHE
jgi:putative ABC transport system permease protein